MKKFGIFRAAFAFVLLVSAVSGLADAVDWEDDTWNFGGTNQLGWQSGQSSGASATGLVTVSFLKFGTADGTHTAFATNNISLFSGFTVGSTDGVAAFGTSGDLNGGSQTNYVLVRLSFTQAVTSVSFQVGDVDDSTTWQDFITVDGTLTGSLVGTTYSISSPNQVQTNYLGKTGVLGLTDIDFAYDLRTSAMVNISLSGAVDQIDIAYLQGPQGSDTADHRIWVSDVSFVQIPEPRSVIVLVLGFATLLLSKVKNQGRRAP